MFKFTKLIRNSLNFTQKPSQEQGVDDLQKESKVGLHEKVGNLLESIISYIGNEFKIIAERSKDLSTSNYNLGMKHFENGNLKEAIFRFKITKKFWPDNYPAYYQLVVCLLMDNQFEKAKKVANELIEKNPDYKEKIDQLINESK